jgi:hypothetical protein
MTEPKPTSSTLAKTADTFDDYADKGAAAAAALVVALSTTGLLPAEWQPLALLIGGLVFTVVAIVRDLATSARKRERTPPE